MTEFSSEDHSHSVAMGGFYSALAGIVVAAMAAIIKWGSHAFSTEFLLAVRWGVGSLAFLAICSVKYQVLPYKTSHFWRLFLLAATWLVINSSIVGQESKEVITFYSLGVGFLICLGILAITGFHVANWERHLFPPPRLAAALDHLSLGYGGPHRPRDLVLITAGGYHCCLRICFGGSGQPLSLFRGDLRRSDRLALLGEGARPVFRTVLCMFHSRSGLDNNPQGQEIAFPHPSPYNTNPAQSTGSG